MECRNYTSPLRSRLDGIGRNESKFEETFVVSISLSVQGKSASRDKPYNINTSSLGIKPPVCCSNNEEFNRIMSKTADKGTSQNIMKEQCISQYCSLVFSYSIYNIYEDTL